MAVVHEGHEAHEDLLPFVPSWPSWNILFIEDSSSPHFRMVCKWHVSIIV
jgi:hypothetical protein